MWENKEWVYYPFYYAVNANTVLHARISREEVNIVKERITVSVDYF